MMCIRRCTSERVRVIWLSFYITTTKEENNMKNTLWRRVLLFALVLVTVLSVSIPSLAEGYNWFGDHANGSASTGTATGGYSIIYGNAEDCVVGYRFALIKSDGCYVNSTKNNVKDVFFDNYSGYIESVLQRSGEIKLAKKPIWRYNRGNIDKGVRL